MIKPMTNLNQSILRKKLLTMHYEAGVGHIGGNLSAIDAIVQIFHNHLSPQDSFILSKGHSAGALYVSLWSVGKITEDQLNTFHQDSTLLPGHPPSRGIDGIQFATGSLGHGLSLAAGTALSRRMKNTHDKVFCLTSDGEWQEGSTWEALFFAIHHKLNNLTILIDHNNLQGFGTVSDVASMSPLWEKIKGLNLRVDVVDGHNANDINNALNNAMGQLTLIFLKTVKGKGVSSLENKMESHYLPLSKDQYETALRELNLNES